MNTFWEEGEWVVYGFCIMIIFRGKWLLGVIRREKWRGDVK